MNIFNGPFSTVQFDRSLVFEFDKCLPQWLVNIGEKSFYRFPFEYNHHVYDNDHRPFFGNMLYSPERGVSPDTPPFVTILVEYIQEELFNKIDKNFNSELKRIIVNGQTSVNMPAAHMDDDINEDSWTLIYYVNDSNGDTIFYKDKNSDKETYRVKYKRGKMVLFPSSFVHQALAPSEEWRVSIGMMFKLKTKYNKYLKVVQQ